MVPTSPSPRPSTSWRWLLLATVGCVYLATRQRLFTIDSLHYLWNVEHADWSYLFHPHHLILEPLLRLWWRLWQAGGWLTDAVVPLQVLNVLVTLAALALAARLLLACWQVLPAAGGRSRPSDRGGATRSLLPWWLLLAFGFLTWHQATQTEGLPLFLLLSTAGSLWAVRLPLRAATRPPRTRTALQLAALMAAGVLVHQALVLWTPLLTWMLVREAPPGHRLRLGAVALGAAGFAVGGSYLAACLAVHESASPAVLADWCTSYRQQFAGRCGSVDLLVSTDVLRGLGATFLTGSPLKPYVFAGRAADLAAAWHLATFVIVAALLAAGLVRLPGLLAGRGEPDRARQLRALRNLLLLIAVSGLFAGWWEPSNRKFWAPLVPGLVALAALGWHRWHGRRLLGRTGPVVAVAAVLAGQNLVGGILPNHRQPDRDQPLIAHLAVWAGAGDTVILPESRPWLCLRYFAPDQPAHGISGTWTGDQERSEAERRRAARQAARSLRAGRAVLVTECQWPPLATLLAAEFETLPTPLTVLDFADPDQSAAWTLLELRLPHPPITPPTAAAAGPAGSHGTHR